MKTPNLLEFMKKTKVKVESPKVLEIIDSDDFDKRSRRICLQILEEQKNRNPKVTRLQGYKDAIMSEWLDLTSKEYESLQTHIDLRLRRVYKFEKPFVKYEKIFKNLPAFRDNTVLSDYHQEHLNKSFNMNPEKKTDECCVLILQKSAYNEVLNCISACDVMYSSRSISVSQANQIISHACNVQEN